MVAGTARPPEREDKTLEHAQCLEPATHDAFLEAIRRLTQAFVERREAGEVHRLADLGWFYARKQQSLRRVALHQPGLVIVLSGTKRIARNDRWENIHAGQLAALPAPIELDMSNVPDARGGRYLSLLLPFTEATQQRLHNAYGRELAQGATRPVHNLREEADPLTQASILHLLQLAVQNDPDPVLIEHRRLDVLLSLIRQNKAPQLLMRPDAGWAQRVRALLTLDPARNWSINALCDSLALTESTLRRRLREEGTGFRELLDDVRQCTALELVTQTRAPIQEIAYRCGYQSASHFIQRFRERYGMTPTALRD